MPTTIPFGISIVDEEGTILFLNDKLKNALEIDAIGKKCWNVYRDNKKKCDYCPLKMEGIHREETKTTKADTLFGEKSFLITHTGLYYEGKKAMLEIFQDISKKGEEERRIKEAREMKSEFLSMISHELKSPLTAIKEAIGIVMDGIAGELVPEQKDFLSIARRNVDRLTKAINDVLDFEKPLSNKKELLHNYLKRREKNV